LPESALPVGAEVVVVEEEVIVVVVVAVDIAEVGVVEAAVVEVAESVTSVTDSVTLHAIVAKVNDATSAMGKAILHGIVLMRTLGATGIGMVVETEVAIAMEVVADHMVAATEVQRLEAATTAVNQAIFREIVRRNVKSVEVEGHTTTKIITPFSCRRSVHHNPFHNPHYLIEP